MKNPERGEPFPELPKHVDLHSVPAEAFFEWIQADMQRKRLIKGEMTFNRTYTDDILEPLEEYITRTFEGNLPEVLVQTVDATQTHDVHQLTPYITTIRAMSVPRDDTEQVDDRDVYPSISIQGRLFGFRKGEEGELRMLVEDARHPEQLLPGGLYIPFISVAVEGSVIEYATDPKDAFKELNQKIIDKIEKMDTGGGIRGLYVSLINRLDAADQSTKSKLYNVSLVISEFAHYIPQFEANPLMEDLFDVIKYKLNLNVPQAIRTSSHREINTKYVVRSYTLAGPEVFRNVTLQLDMIGESSQRKLGIEFFTNEQPARAIELPVESILEIFPEPSSEK